MRSSEDRAVVRSRKARSFEMSRYENEWKQGEKKQWKTNNQLINALIIEPRENGKQSLLSNNIAIANPIQKVLDWNKNCTKISINIRWWFTLNQ